jgi:hypothetical protein
MYRSKICFKGTPSQLTLLGNIIKICGNKRRQIVNQVIKRAKPPGVRVSFRTYTLNDDLLLFNYEHFLTIADYVILRDRTLPPPPGPLLIHRISSQPLA